MALRVLWFKLKVRLFPDHTAYISGRNAGNIQEFGHKKLVETLQTILQTTFIIDY